jgi:dephospho-CoA kinase
MTPTIVLEMKVLGVTGGIGMGKSACGELLRERGIQVIDTDQIARDLVRPGEPALREITEAFGQDVLDSAGALDRGRLAVLVFGNGEARKRLEQILHPRIRERWQTEARELSAKGPAIMAVLIPLLFEVGAQDDVDVTICVACSQAVQLNRLRQRGWSDQEIGQRIGAQMCLARKMELSDYVIWSEGSFDLHRAQLDKVLTELGWPED